jgi:hypothetical protein
MINLHLNGDIVRCPDIKLIQERARERRIKNNVCIYNIHEDSCKTWQDSLMNWQNTINKGCAGSCMLSGSDICPERQKRQQTGKMKKQFRIDNTNYRKVASAAHHLVKTSEHKSIFITLTFPPFKKEYNEKQLNECFSRFVENLRTNYNCSGYVAVRERGEVGNRNHFHIVLSIPFVPFYILNGAWCSAISDLCEYSPRAVTSKRKRIILKKPANAVRYICKYISKSKGQTNDSRIIFISNNLVKKPVQLDYLKTGYRTIADFFKDWNSLTVETTEYTTMLRFNDNTEFNEFCERVLYPCFDIDDKKEINLNAFPIKSG